ncbi:glycosyl hydrolase family 18 protein [Chitinibacter tainanensis]|uniref:glycosyl hydrolase family 18 protein n=1 Tax=Chitinibacter tainanensis TaxID=230667 RepID=UPI002352AF8B|nr:glycosyl hydrolase family 18 protein [Chitinibacter tainanensis]
MRLPVFCWAWLCGLLMATASAGQLTAYYPYWVSYAQTRPLADLPLARLNQLTYAFARFTPQGELIAGDNFADLTKPYTLADGRMLRGNFALLREQKRLYPRLKTVLAVGGWNYSAQISTALQPAQQARAVRSTLALLAAQGFDGIEIDWRYPVAGGKAGNAVDAADGEHLLAFVSALRRAQPGLRIGLAIGTQPYQWQGLRWAELAAQVDYFMLIATDFVGAWSGQTGHKSPLYAPPGQVSIASAVDTVLGYGVKPAQLSVLIPTQGISFNAVPPMSQGLGQPHGGVSMGSWDNEQTGATGVFGQDELAALRQDGDFVEHWDPLAKATTFYSASKRQFISVESQPALAAKLDFARARGLRGIALWELTSDAADYRLLRQIEHDAAPWQCRWHDLQYWWRHHPAWVELLLGCILAAQLALMLQWWWRRKQRAQLLAQEVAQITQLRLQLSELPIQLLTLAELAEQGGPAQQPWVRRSRQLAWQLQPLLPAPPRPALATPAVAVESVPEPESAVAEEPGEPSTPAVLANELAAAELSEATLGDAPQATSLAQAMASPSAKPAASAAQRLQRLTELGRQLGEQRSLEKMLEITLGFLATEPLVRHSSVLDLDADEASPSPRELGVAAQRMSQPLDDYVLQLEFTAPLDEDDAAYFQSLLQQLQIVRRQLYELGRQPQLLSEVYEIASRRDKLLFIRADKGYSAIHASDLVAPLYITLRLRAIRLYFEESLLVQVHRSYLVNPRKVTGMSKRGREHWSVLLGETAIPVARSMVPRLREQFPHWFTE